VTNRYLTTTKMAWVRRPRNRRIFAALAIVLFVAYGATAFLNVSGWLAIGVFAIAGLCYWLVFIGVRGVSDARARELDERQLQIRNSTYFIAWQINTGVLFTLLVILALVPDWLAIPNAYSPETFWLALGFLAAATPALVLAFRRQSV